MTILDVGGAVGDQFEYGRAPDAVVDIFPQTESKRVRQWIAGDACSQTTWDRVADRSFDFSICSHMLEDCYDPFVVLRNLSRVSRQGYIEVPRAWIETTRWQIYRSRHIKGYAHHIWMVDVFPTEFLDSCLTINPVVTRPGERYPRNASGLTLCFYPKMVLAHHDLLHHTFIGSLRARLLRRKYGPRLEAVSVHWTNEIPYACIWWGTSHLEAKAFWTDYHRRFDYDSLPECYRL